MSEKVKVLSAKRTGKSREEYMKFISWNVNGIRACVQKGFMDVFNELDADIFCIQESKMQAGQLELDMPDIISIGIMRRRRDIRVPGFLQRKNRYQ